MKAMSRKGFTLIEILIVVIILGILAAIVIPQFSSATDDTRKASMLSSLKSLRTQVALFQMEHRDVPPSTTDATFWGQMTQTSNEDGTASGDRVRTATNAFGPYFENKVTNPVMRSTTIAAAPASGIAWVYNVVNGNDVKLFACIPDPADATGATFIATADGKTGVDPTTGEAAAVVP